jgi:4-hydroxy-tetrahydrodipicolinate synthase
LNESRLRGVWCATLTPLDASGAIDVARFRDHVQTLLASGVDGVAPFGTTGEGQSFTLDERRAGVDALITAGVDPRRIAPATGCAALGDTIGLTRHAIEAGCRAVLVLPPFFFKRIGDDGVFASYARLIERVNDDRLRLYLYHIPQVSGVPIGHDAIERLLAHFPGVVGGVKDSSGDLANSLALARRFPSLDILVGHEPHLPAMLAAGGAGTICGLANLYPATLRRLYDVPNDAEPLAFVQRLIGIFVSYALMPAIKGVRALLSRDPAWYAVREPLLALNEAERRLLAEAFARLSAERKAA